MRVFTCIMVGRSGIIHDTIRQTLAHTFLCEEASTPTLDYIEEIVDVDSMKTIKDKYENQYTHVKMKFQ